MAEFASTAWILFNDKLQCVDEEYCKRAFRLVWLARGEADKAQTLDGKTLKAIKVLDKMPFDCE